MKEVRDPRAAAQPQACQSVFQSCSAQIPRSIANPNGGEIRLKASRGSWSVRWRACDARLSRSCVAVCKSWRAVQPQIHPATKQVKRWRYGMESERNLQDGRRRSKSKSVNVTYSSRSSSYLPSQYLPNRVVVSEYYIPLFFKFFKQHGQQYE